MTMFNEAELIRQLEEQRAVIVQKSAQVNWLQTENSVLHKKCEELQMTVELQREFIKSPSLIHRSNFEGENGTRSVCSPLIQESAISAHCCNI